MTKFIASVIAMGALATSAFAADDGAMIDADGDGMMSIEEVTTVYPEVTPDQFSQADTNGDGVLDDVEMKDAQEQGVMPAPAAE